MTTKYLISTIALILSGAFAGGAFGQDSSWRRFENSAFAFQYPSNWKTNAQQDQDVIVGNPATGLAVEFAVSPGDGSDPNKLSLNAQKHVMQFAQMNHAYAKFESANQLDNGAVRVISHICSMPSDHPKLCRSDDPHILDISSVIMPVPAGRVLLIEMMHQPGLPEVEVETGRKVVQTLDVK